MSEELKNVYDKAKDLCLQIECPTCRTFCREWLDFGIAVYKLINDEKPTDSEKITLKRYYGLVIEVMNNKGRAVGLVIEED